MCENNENLNEKEELQDEEVVLDEKGEEYIKVEIDSVTEKNEDGEEKELLEVSPKKKSAAREALDWVLSIACAFLIVALLNMFVFVQVNVSGSSMDPTLKNNDRLIAVRFMYKPKVGDIVVVQPYLYEGTVKGKLMFGRILYIKRVIAVGGQTIDMRQGKVYIDGELLKEDYLASDVRTFTQSTKMPVTIPEGHVFVMGDNREGSKDSRDRTVGILRDEQVVGKATFRIFPFNKFGVVK